MKSTDAILLLLLAALWGASYLFMRIAAPEFGAFPLAGLRAAIAATALLGVVLVRGRGLRQLRTHAGPIALVGLTNSAAPFVLFGFATQVIPAGLAGILTATTPLFTALIARFRFGEPLGVARGAGLAIGFAGVVILAADHLSLAAKPSLLALALGTCLAAAALYGFSSQFAQRRLPAVDPVTVAAGSQLASALALALPLATHWPASPPSTLAWGALLLLGLLCTAAAYIVFFGLIRRIGAARTMTVTYLIPVFGVLWGAIFLGEPIPAAMLLGGAAILTGTAFATHPALLRRLVTLIALPELPTRL